MGRCRQPVAERADRRRAGHVRSSSGLRQQRWRGKVTADQPRVREVESLARSPSKAGLQERAIASTGQEVIEKARVEDPRHDARPAESLAGSAVGGPSVSGITADKAAARKRRQDTTSGHGNEHPIQIFRRESGPQKIVVVAKDAASTGVVPAENKAPSNEHAKAAVPPIVAIAGNALHQTSHQCPQVQPRRPQCNWSHRPRIARPTRPSPAGHPHRLGAAAGGRVQGPPDAVPSGSSDAPKGKFAEASQTTQLAKGTAVVADSAGSFPSPSGTKSEEKSLLSPFGRGVGGEGTSAMKSGAGQIVPAATYVR